MNLSHSSSTLQKWNIDPTCFLQTQWHHCAKLSANMGHQGTYSIGFSLKLELHDKHEGWTKNLHFNPINKKAAHFSYSRLWISGNLKPSKNAEAGLKPCRKYEVLQSLLCLWSLHSMFECAQMQLLRAEPSSHDVCRNCVQSLVVTRSEDLHVLLQPWGWTALGQFSSIDTPAGILTC